MNQLQQVHLGLTILTLILVLYLLYKSFNDGFEDGKGIKCRQSCTTIDDKGNPKIDVSCVYDCLSNDKQFKKTNTCSSTPKAWSGQLGCDSDDRCGCNDGEVDRALDDKLNQLVCAKNSTTYNSDMIPVIESVGYNRCVNGSLAGTQMSYYEFA